MPQPPKPMGVVVLGADMVLGADLQASDVEMDDSVTTDTANEDPKKKIAQVSWRFEICDI